MRTKAWDRSERAHRLDENGNWKGGRHVASNGYVKVCLGEGHPDADQRGYVYEHRLIASRMLGRSLLPGEIVHHKDGDKANNDPSNLEVKPSRAHHQAEHRTRDSGRRLPDEPNPMVTCECGCGEAFSKFDASGRTRRFVSGHNIQSRCT